MERKPIDVQYTPQGNLRLLGALVKVLLIVMILGISIIVAIIVKEIFFDTENKTTKIIAPESLSIPNHSNIESIYLDDNRIYLLVNSRNKKQEILIIELEDGMEISRKSVKLVNAD
ncbi:MAG: DUF6476 family protein [Paracoccaceae bacterium]|nr:DUF6476 family protein [Paracoccaceae bacterium]